MGSYNTISRIAIIGAGPTGIACAKFLLAEKAFSKIDIFEQRERVGGIWNLSAADRTKRIPIPQEDPEYGSHHRSEPKRSDSVNDSQLNGINNDSLEFESPLYDLLEANIPKQMMQYPDTPFPDHYPLYPSHEETLEYLERYADEVRSMIRFNTQVQSVKSAREDHGSGPDLWEVVTRNLVRDSISRNVYDAIVVASGHYTVPHVVALKGLSQWNSAYAGSILHSKAYRKPDPFKGQRVLVIGNSASGSDIASQIGPISSQLYLSSRSESIFLTNDKVSWKEDIDEVVEFLPSQEHNRAVRTKSGRIIENLDIVIFATGYFFSFPFISELESPLITNGLRTRDIYQHFIHIEHPSLAFPVLNHKIIPFGLAQSQGAILARLWSGRLPMPSKKEMRQWEKETLEAKGAGKHFHLKKFPEEAAQMNDLYRWALSAIPKSGLENDGMGRLGWHWDEQKVWLRSQFIALKKKYTEKGEGRRNIHHYNELGFDYDVWRRNAKPEDLEMFKSAKCLS